MIFGDKTDKMWGSETETSVTYKPLSATRIRYMKKGKRCVRLGVGVAEGGGGGGVSVSARLMVPPR